MKRRREHGECETRPNGRGCLVFGTKICTYRKPVLSRMQNIRRIAHKLFSGLGILLWWLCLTLLGAGLAWGWMERQRRVQMLAAGVSVAPDQVSTSLDSGF
jgi:hypothetical protein